MYPPAQLLYANYKGHLEAVLGGNRAPVSHETIFKEATNYLILKYN
jgi:hypothetical protein